MNTSTIIPVDIGYGYTKTLSPAGQSIVFPSEIGIAEEIQFTGDVLTGNDAGGGINLLTDDGWRSIGELALQQCRVHWSMRDRKRTGTADTLALALAALSEAGAAGQVQVVTGLPVKWWKQDHETLRAQLRGQHTIKRAGFDDVDVEITDVLVTIQPFGSLFSVIYNDQGKIVNAKTAKGRAGVIDIGTFTTDYVIYDAGRYIEPGSGSIETAMSRVYELVAAQVEREFNHVMNMYETDRAMRAGKVTVRGRSQSLADIVEPILRGVSQKILSGISNRWSDYESGLDNIFVSGGGANVIGPYLIDRFPHLAILPDGALANVRGYHRYGLYKQRRTQPAPTRTRKPISKAKLNGRVKA